MKSKKQNLKDFVNKADKTLNELGSARTKILDTSKDQKDKQLMAPNKKKKKSKNL